MTKYIIGGKEYHPGDYGEKPRDAENLADQYLEHCEKEPSTVKKHAGLVSIPPGICFSRKIGSGALEIADMVGKELGLQVMDREIIEHIAATRDLSRKTVNCFDERYPGKIKEFLSAILGEKSFVLSDYARQLFTTVYSIAGMESTVFVGRGVHLCLPRERVLAVRIIAGSDFRQRRLSETLGVSEKEAAEKLDKIDREQDQFFRIIYGKDGAPASEFDLVINRDYLKKTETASELVVLAFNRKFERAPAREAEPGHEVKKRLLEEYQKGEGPLPPDPAS